jgi:phthiocerol/phenolphthiocerol synthesis type-I polyketide synthase B
VSKTASSPQMPVAIIGIGCRFPGGIVDAASFWRVLSTGTDTIAPIPPDRFSIDRYFDPRPATPGRIMTRWGGFLDRVDEFDASFFGIAPREAERMDPQQRLLLEIAWEALEDAGQDVTTLDGSPTGVFVGQWMNDFESRVFADPQTVDFFAANGGGRYSTSGRISYALGLRGASLTVDTACSSSLVTIHLAVRSIRSGESRLALAGGVNIILQPQITIAYSQSRMMAPDGRCKFGDASGDGYVRSEGAGIVVLKALPQALADGDRIYAVIRGSAVNNDGHSSGSMSTPSRIGQEELLRQAYRDASVDPGVVGYIEAHGTGTRAGDPVELGALGAVLREARDPRQAAYIGSIKTNLGHTEAAAGVAGLIKLALSLQHREIPKSLHFKEPNPAIPWAELPFALAKESVTWPEPIAGVRIGGVNSFGVSGTNAHVVLEEAPSAAANVAATGSTPALLVLSARSPQALRELAGRYRDLLIAQTDLSLHDVCWSAATRRTTLEYRAAFVAATREDLQESLRAYAAGEAADVTEGSEGNERPRLAFVCPGHGAQWVGMARDLFAQEPVFRAALEECDAAARRYVTWSVLEQIHADRGAPNFLMDRVDVVQPVLLSLTIAYARLLQSVGIHPEAVVGHSMGEASAAYLAGVIDLDWAMRITCRRSIFMQRTAGQGAMALIDLPMEQVQSRLAAQGIAATVTVGVVNSPRSCVVSGDPEAIRSLIAALERESVFCRLVKVDVASHSAQMDPVVSSLVPELSGLVPAAAHTPIYSTLLARRAVGGEFDPAYWGKNIRDTVLLGPAISSMLDDGLSLFVEIGPHPVVLPSIEQTAGALRKRATTLAVARRDQPERLVWLRAAAALWCAGYALDWRSLFRGAGNAVALPSYPWQRERHWVETAELSAGGPSSWRTASRPDASTLAWLYQLAWKPAAIRETVARASTGPVLVVGHGEPASTLVAAFGSQAMAVSRAEFAAAVRAQAPGTIVILIDDADDAFVPMEVVQSLLATRLHRPVRLWFVTRGAQIVGGEAEQASITQAALWGAARVVAEEHPELWGGLIDLDPRRPFHEAAPRIVEEIAAAGADDQIAFREATRFVLRLTRASRQTAASDGIQWRADAAYLVTGGLGDVGLHLARAMAANGARRLVLVGRTALPPRDSWSRLSPDDPAARRVAAIREIEAQGVAVHTAALDVSDERQLTAFLERYAAEAWPPIRGVVHAAGTLDNKLARDMDAASFHSVVRAKLSSAQALDRLLPDLELFVLCSSTGAFLAQPGQANYAAANAGLDAIALNRKRRGSPALSIQWGIWKDTGLVKGDAGARNIGELARQGVHTFTPEQGTALFTWLIRSTHASVCVLPIDWSVYAPTRAGRRAGLFEDILADVTASGDSLPNPAASLAQADPAKRRQILESTVKDAVTHVLKVPASRLDPRKALGEMGLNSLMAMEIRNRLETALGRSLSATLAWNYPTVEALVQHLANTAVESQQPAATNDQDASPDVADSLRAVNELSDEEAALALRSRT